jgi:hypothetical protein
MSTRFIQAADGSIVYPNRGLPPLTPKGYRPAPGDPFRFLPNLPSCVNREIIKKILPCGKVSENERCNKGLQMGIIECTCCEHRREK